MLTERIQAAIDREVANSPRARQLLQELDGRSLCVRAHHTPWQLRMLASADQLRVDRSDAVSDVTILGSPMALLAMTREPPMDVIRRGDVKIEGDSVLAEQFQELAALLRPDLEESLARIIGDIPAHGLGQMLRAALGYGRQSAQTTVQNVGEYLAHEKRELVPRAEAENFLQGVEHLREHADRLAARIAVLETQRSAAMGSPPGTRELRQ
jgi:ubiquinone biosynthesis protein UbiJ